MTPAMTAAWTVLVPLADKAPDPNDVKPGWAGFLTFIFLVVAVTLLVLSFRKQLRKVNFEERGEGATGGEGARGGTGSTGEAKKAATDNGSTGEAKKAATDNGEAGPRPS